MFLYLFRQLSRNIRLLQTERDSWLLWNRARDALNNTQQDLPPIVSIHSRIFLFCLKDLCMQIPGSSDRLIVEHHLLNNPQLRMAKAVQEWLQTIKLDERYQTDMKIAMAKLEPKRIYWFERSHFNQFVLLSIVL